VWIRSHMQPIAPRCGCDSGVGYDLRKWRGWSMRSILDHGETPAGVCRLPRTVCEIFRELYCDGRRQFADFGFLDRFVWHGVSAPSANVWR
jgi:hypothetical protein